MLTKKRVKIVGVLVVVVVLLYVIAIEIQSIQASKKQLSFVKNLELSLRAKSTTTKPDIVETTDAGAHVIKKEGDEERRNDTSNDDAINGFRHQPMDVPPSPPSLQRSNWCGPDNSPQTKIKYIKTHKTGSSTLTNIFHRFGEANDLNMALPRDNLFYAWPSVNARGIANSIEHIGNRNFPYDILASGHVAYVKEGLNEIVPGGTFVTILRNPYTHFTSSWAHWHVYDHIKHNGGPMLTVYEFLENFHKYKDYMSPSDKLLLINNMASDLGLHNPTVESTKLLIQDMEDNFGTVLITEYMMESLVLMKRRLCWTLNDVLHMSLKVSHEHKAMVVKDHPSLKKLDELNFADLMLYRHFNASFWRQVEEEKKNGFDKEVEELKEMVNMHSKNCQRFVNYDEDAHRVELEENLSLDKQDRLCHLMMLDSKGFVKHLKKRDGYPIEKLECFASSYTTKLMHLVTDNPADVQVSNIFALNSVLVKTLTYEDVNNVEQVPDGMLPRPPIQVHRPASSFALSVRGLTYDRNFMDAFSPNMMYISTFRHPVQEFLDAWTRLKIEEMMRAVDPSLENALDEYLDNTDYWHQALNRKGFNVQRHLTNRIGYFMGVPLQHTPAQMEHALNHIWWFTHIIIAERPVESLVFLRRMLCWKLDDVVKVDLKEWTKATSYKISSFTSRPPLRVEKRLLEINHVDFELYRRASDVFALKTKRQVSFADEIEMFNSKRQTFLNSCESSSPQVGCGKLNRSRREALRGISPSHPLQPFNPPQILLDIDEPRE
eukprot:m.7674 g.7674  ORF g.7674 m.7674 type:complete len:774 (-) comp2884_c0_seq2:1336-3657(-)